MRKPRLVAKALAGTALLLLPVLLAVSGGDQRSGDLPWTGVSAQGNGSPDDDLPWT